MLAQYLPGVLLLAMVASAIAYVVALFVSMPRRAIIRSAALSTILLEIWAYAALGGFDLGFLAILALISTVSSAVVVAIVGSFRRSRRIVT